ncbi:DNA-processing protein DprA [Sagittula salina]|uniref:DNA-processing protein DprA n=1 Tax=Sagittula salina TaxID=2820268 RepID=A0A940RZT3_9RHOB|nr:DNA-processing protein DprA [Sagittula salina]MBP0481322.1 DNA-processing protein DprA [Sagittula salina]
MREDSYSSTHPPLPPTTEDARVDWLRLLRSRRVGVSTFWRLLAEHGSAATALEALPEVARAAGVDRYEPCPEGVVLAEMKVARQTGARLVAHGTPDYPPDLAELSDAPPLLWLVGQSDALCRPMVALVGARNASSLGLRMARSLAEGLGEAGYVVVSGLARGIDAAAHHAAIGTGTVGVLAGGVDVLYPAENARLAEEIAEKGGARLSEQPMGMQPLARHFPMRNRIVSGLSRAVVVVEAAGKSGSLITARGALDQGREVLAVPGHPLDARASGCNMLIRDGAWLVRGVDDILEVLPACTLPASQQSELDLGPSEPVPSEHRARGRTQPNRPKARSRPEVSGGEVSGGQEPRRTALRRIANLHREILDRLGPSPTAEDQLVRDLQMGADQVASALTELELDGAVQRQPGGFLSIVPKG